MMNILKAMFGTEEYVSRADTSANDPDPDPNDIWAFTDPDARDTFADRGDIKKLEHDIRFEVMRGESWQPEELEYKREIQRLLKEGIIADKGSFWFSSPFPTVYRAKRDGSLTISGREFVFAEGQDIVFQCRMTRDMNRSLMAPVLLDRLRPTDRTQLCGDMGSAMKGMKGM
jgi:hypothetical protein